MSQAPTTYVVTCLYGLEGLLANEVRQRLGAEAEHHWCEAVFPFQGPAARLRELRLAGNVFVRFDRFPIGGTVPDLDGLAARLGQLPLDRWEESWRELWEPPDGDISVSVRRTGEHNFTYADVEELALDVVRRATGRRTMLDPRPLELRIEIDGPWCRLLGRLTPAPLSERPYRRYHSPGETDATLAAAMVMLSDPRPGERFLDPFCGGGTVPIERALHGACDRVVAGELKARRVAWARGNAEVAGAAVLFAQWDGYALPLADRSFDRIVTSPPQSDPSNGRPWEVEAFAGLVAEALRVLRHGGLMVWLVQRSGLFKRALRHLGIASRFGTTVCHWKGRPWGIHTLAKGQ